MFQKVLIANRGEVALRIIRTCRAMGITTAIVYSEADRHSLPVLLADEAYFIGASPSKDSYLNIPHILEAIDTSQADALHPGYGFLSENANFARTLEEKSITFIGPSSKAIALMGDKIKARQVMQSSGMPTVPGSKEHALNLDHLKSICKDIGFPVMLKAAFGGGGKGMRIVQSLDDLELSYKSAKSEALNYFSNDQIYVEKFIQNPKHIEIQIFADAHQNVVCLYERECSVQRRHQKLIEESPSIVLPNDVRQKMQQVAIKATQAINYLGAGTFEFIFDQRTKEFFFMEMNTRLQVEHPVTEMVTGFDLVKEQINVANGKPLSFRQEDVHLNGHAIEARICVEDPHTHLPTPGRIQHCHFPQGPFIRVDSYIYTGYDIPIDYDNMVAKLIVWGQSRTEALERLQGALSETCIFGVKTNLPLLRSILKAKPFVEGSYTTELLKDFQFSDKEIDEALFLIPAVIETYEKTKQKTSRPSVVNSPWKLKGRWDSLRKL